MKLWIDHCLSPMLEGVANARNYEATSNRRRKLSATFDENLYPIVLAEDWVFVTNNAGDFRTLATLEGLHPGLIIMPQRTRAEQRQMLDEILTYIEEQAKQEGEQPVDWMVMREVVYDDETDTISHGWLPGP